MINSAKTIRIPAYMVTLLSKWRRASASLAEELGRTPTPEEVARILGLPKKKLPLIKKALRIYNCTLQSDQAEARWSLGELVDERIKSPEDEFLEHELLVNVLDMIETMDTRETTVLRMRFGLDDSEPHTLREIGDQLGLTPERVRQIETKALNKLGEGLKEGYRVPTRWSSRQGCDPAIAARRLTNRETRSAIGLARRPKRPFLAQRA